MPTPVFDQQILRLRRRLGDIYDADRVEINTTNIGTLDGEVWTRVELVDVYNMAVSAFQDYMVTHIPKRRWYEFMPGYVHIKTDVPAPGGLDGELVDLTALSPPLLAVLDLRKAGSRKIEDSGVEMSPDDYFSNVSTSNKVRTPSLQYIVLSNTTPSLGLHIVSATTVSTVDMVYLHQHQHVDHGDANDIPRITEPAKDRILLLAELEARKHKQEDVSDIPELRLQQIQQLDGARQ